MKQSILIFTWIMAALCIAGCDRTVVIQGRVVDVNQHALPGVAVGIRGAEYDAVTDALGYYELRCAPGPLSLEYLKTGYTPGRLEHMDPAIMGEGFHIRFVKAVDVLLWPLPPGKGLFLFQREQARYLEANPAQAKPFIGKDGPVFGIQTAPELKLNDTQPFLASYRLPAYDVRLDKLHEAETALPATMAPPAFTERAWVREANVPIVAIPIDEPGEYLLELRPAQPLEPGRYALHWGALDGHTSTEERLYLFEIAAPETPEGETAPAASEGENPGPKPPSA